MTGKQYRHERIAALSKHLRDKLLNNAYDIVLLQELWRKDDHQTVYSNLPSGYYMTTFSQLNVWYCHITGSIFDPFGCSGLAIISKYPIVNAEFHKFGMFGHGYVWDGEAFGGKGFGVVRIFPSPKAKIDIYVTHLIAGCSKQCDEFLDWIEDISDYDNSNRQLRLVQTKQILEHIDRSDADVVSITFMIQHDHYVIKGV